jgi:hypothetical protein
VWPPEDINAFRHNVGAREHDAELLDPSAPERKPAQMHVSDVLQDYESQLQQGSQFKNHFAEISMLANLGQCGLHRATESH